MIPAEGVPVLVPVDGRRLAEEGEEAAFLEGLARFFEYRRATGSFGEILIYGESPCGGAFWASVREAASRAFGCRLAEGVLTLKAAFRAARADLAVVWRAESGIPPKEAELVWRLVAGGAAAAAGSRFRRGAVVRTTGGSAAFVWEEKLAAAAFRAAAHSRLSDPAAGLWAMRAAWLEPLPESAAGPAQCAALAERLGKAPAERPVMWIARRPRRWLPGRRIAAALKKGRV